MAGSNTKANWIKTHFGIWREDVSRVEILLNSPNYFIEAVLVLACYIGVLASARFPGRAESDSYKRIVNRYSGLQSLYDKVDLLFFYQWPRSSYQRPKNRHARPKSKIIKNRHAGPYGKIKGYSQIKRHLIRHFGKIESIRDDPKRRYVTIPTLLKRFNPLPSGLSRQDVSKTLKLFTVGEVLYRYVRCHAVHENLFPLFGTVTSVNGTNRYTENHLITGARLLETVKNIVNSLEQECLAKTKLPWQLYNR